jgi:hypothetical protein
MASIHEVHSLYLSVHAMSARLHAATAMSNMSSLRPEDESHNRHAAGGSSQGCGISCCISTQAGNSTHSPAQQEPTTPGCCDSTATAVKLKLAMLLRLRPCPQLLLTTAYLPKQLSCAQQISSSAECSNAMRAQYSHVSGEAPTHNSSYCAGSTARPHELPTWPVPHRSLAMRLLSQIERG